MNVSLTEKQERYIADLLKSGDFKNASEVVRDALRLHEVYTQKVLQDLRNEITKGWEGASSDRKPSDIAQARYKSHQRP